MRLTPKAAILSVVLMVLLLYMMVPLRSYLEQRARLTELQRQATSLQQQQARLLNQIAELQDRYHEYFAGGMGAESVKDLVSRLDLAEVETDLKETIATAKGQPNRKPQVTTPAQADLSR